MPQTNKGRKERYLHVCRNILVYVNMKKTKKNIAIKNAVNYVDNIMRLQYITSLTEKG